MAEKTETKEAKTIRLAQARMTRALNVLNGIANLGGSTYALSDAHKKKLIDDLVVAVDGIKSRFAGSTTKNTGGYQL